MTRNSCRPRDPSGPGALALLDAHLAFVRSCMPERHVHALEDLTSGPDVPFRGAREGAPCSQSGPCATSGTGTSRQPMHTSRPPAAGWAARCEHLVALAEERGGTRLSLETGTIDAFAPARAHGLRIHRVRALRRHWSNEQRVHDSHAPGRGLVVQTSTRSKRTIAGPSSAARPCRQGRDCERRPWRPRSWTAPRARPRRSPHGRCADARRVLGPHGAVHDESGPRAHGRPCHLGGLPTARATAKITIASIMSGTSVNITLNPL